MCRGFHGDLVKQLMGQLTAFPVAFLIYFIQRLIEPILANFGQNQFQPKRWESGHMFKLRAWAFGNGAMRFYRTYKVPQESTATNIRKKQARKKGKQFHSKQSKK